MDTIEEQLADIGLDEKEVAVYLALLELGESSGTKVAKAADLPRTTAVYTLEKLEEEGLIEIMQTSSRRKFVPLHPRKIVTILKRRKNEINQEITSFEEVLPDLSEKFRKYSFEPKIRTFRGQEEIREIHEEMLDAPVDEILYVGETQKIEEVLGSRYLKRWINRRIEKGVNAKGIRVAASEVEEDIYLPSEEKLRNVRLAPESFSSPSYVQIWGDNVSIITTAEEDIGVVINSRDIATTMENWFNQLWKVSEEY